MYESVTAGRILRRGGCEACLEAKDRGITTDQVWEERAASYPPGGVATPREVAETIAFFASEESSGVSGEAIRVALGSWY